MKATPAIPPESPRQRLLRAIARHPAQLYRVVGRVVHWERERSWEEARVDHVWLTLDVAGVGLLRATVSTHSWRNEQAGFDPSVRLGSVPEHFDHYPEEGAFPSQGLSYGTIERGHKVEFETLDKHAMEEALTSRAARCRLAEVWGHLYTRRHLGIHNIHSMRKSCAVEDDRIGADGAIQFYYSTDVPAELLLLKFCGQP